MKKKHIALIAIVIWVYLVSIIMVLMRTVNLEIFFVLFLIGILIVIELIDSAFVNPGFNRKLKYMATCGGALFFIIVILKIQEILNR